jgi:hypothetical protein
MAMLEKFRIYNLILFVEPFGKAQESYIYNNLSDVYFCLVQSCTYNMHGDYISKWN